MPTVDYRLARRAVLQGLRSGLRSKMDVCDAHPELMRAARFVGEPTGDDCPICETGELRLLFYTYGLRGRDNGRVRRRTDLDELRRNGTGFVCYVVEVCMDCSWNHLLRSFTTRSRQAG